jgi:hypothetical protein
LEWIGRLCANDSIARQGFASELQTIDPRYFAELPDRCPAPSQDFTFPGLPGKDELKSMLAALWDLIRNGQAHEYHDIIVGLTCGKRWVLMIKGVLPTLTLAEVDRQRPNLRHLDYQIAPDGDLLLGVHPGVMFLDICAAVDRASLLRRGLTITHLERPRKPTTYQYDLSRLDAALAANGLKKVASVERAPKPGLSRRVLALYAALWAALGGAGVVLVVRQLLHGW